MFRATFDLSGLIEELESEGFWVFGLRSDEEYPGIKSNKWPVANVFIMRSDNPKIIKLDLTNMGDQVHPRNAPSPDTKR